MTLTCRIAWWPVAALLLTLAVGCATAGADDADTGPLSHPPDGAPTPDGTPTPDAPPGTPDAGPPDAAPPDAAPPDATPILPCASGAVCSGSVALGEISGDEGNQKLTAQGSQSAWHSLRVKEVSNSTVPVRVAAKLTSPASADFDVFLYVNVNNDVTQECTTTRGTKTTSGKTVTVQAQWSDGFGSDESRNVSIEIRSLSGTCSVDQLWQLEVEGNWQ